jgi:citrate lyase subunit alpha / citrate CoA-transferase
MKKYDRLVKNSMGQEVPEIVNGTPMIPFRGIGGYHPRGNKYGPPIRSCNDFPPDGNKLISSLKEALLKAGLRNGITISTHHHFRNGDVIALRIFEIASEIGIKDLVWFPSASFECHAPMIKYLENGTMNRIEGSMNGSLGRFTSEGGMKGLAVLRSHGTRYQAVQNGEVKIDIAVIAAPTADSFGNANGLTGPTACGSLGFALADSQYADKVIVVTDNLVPFPCTPWHIQGNYVDYVVQSETIGNPDKIVSGTTEITKSPDRLFLAELTARFCEQAGIIRDGFSFQAGAGGTALATGFFFAEIMRKKGIKARFARGGSNRYLVDMLQEGLVEYILDGQTFDQHGIRSMRENSNHLNTSPFTSYNYHGKGNFAQMVDVVILGATEVDLDFNANVVSHSDGLLLHGIGGWQDCLFAGCTILTIPLFRDRIPVVRERVTTLCGPGEMIDVIITERGIAINPLRQDLMDRVKNSGLPLKTLEALKTEAEKICGKPQAIPKNDEIVAVVKWVDGTLIDSVRKVRI